MSDPDPGSINVQLFTISDTRTVEDDESGQLLRNQLEANGYDVHGHDILREDKERLRKAFGRTVDGDDIDVMITSGGTGISGRDQTFDVLDEYLDKTLPGFGELFRQLSYEEVGSYTVMSRTTAGRAGDTILIALPGSPNAVKLALNEIILEILPHMVKEVRA